MASSTPQVSQEAASGHYDPWTIQRSSPEYSAFVSNLPESATIGGLCQAFEGIVRVAGAEVFERGGSGFVHFYDRDDLKKALACSTLVYKDTTGVHLPLQLSPVVEPRNILRVKGLSTKLDAHALQTNLVQWTGGIQPSKVTIMMKNNVSKGAAQVHYPDNESAQTAYAALQKSAPELAVDFAPMRDLQNKLTLRRMELCCAQTLKDLGEDPERPGLKKTPQRWAQALLYLTKGYDENLEELVNGAVFDEKHHELVLVKDIGIHSMCEHHMLPFWGKVHIAYIPRGKVLGLSKLARIAEMYSRRLQVQERLTRQIASAIEKSIKPLGVAVVVDCCHMCMVMRGVQKVGTSTVTSSVLGEFERNASTRAELFSLIDMPKANL